MVGRAPRRVSLLARCALVNVSTHDKAFDIVESVEMLVFSDSHASQGNVFVLRDPSCVMESVAIFPQTPVIVVPVTRRVRSVKVVFLVHVVSSVQQVKPIAMASV